MQAVGRSLDINSCLSARLACSSWCEGISASVTSLCLTPGLIKTVGPAAIARALERMAQAEAVDIAVGPLNRRLPQSAVLEAWGQAQPMPAGHQQQVLLDLFGGPAAAGAAAAAAPGAGAGAVGSGADPAAAAGAAGAGSLLTSPRPYHREDLLQLLQVLARHRPNQKLPTLFVYNESLSRGQRPGMLDLQGTWRSSYVEVRSASGPLWGGGGACGALSSRFPEPPRVVVGHTQNGLREGQSKGAH
jgi:hypothetical protein